MFNINVKNVLGALVSAVLSAVLMYIGNLADISNLDWNQILNIAVTVGATSLLKSLGTTNKGNFAGIPVK